MKLGGGERTTSMELRYIDRLKTSFLAFAAAAMIFAILAPLQIFRGNFAEIEIGIIDYLWMTLPYAFGAVLISSLLLSLFTGRVFQYSVSLLFALVVILILQGNFFLWDYGVFDGRDVSWDTNHSKGLLEVWIYSCVLMAALVFTKKINQYSRDLFLATVVVTILSIVATAYDSQAPFSARRAPPESTRAFRFSKEKNIVVILLDGFLSTAFDELLKRNPTHWKDQFRSFTYFDDTLGVFPSTYLSVPAILSGEIYDNTLPIADFLKTTLREKSLAAAALKHDYTADFITLGRYCRYFEKGVCISRDNFVENETIYKTETLKVMDLILFRYANHFIKSSIYHDHSWFFQRTFLNRLGSGAHRASIAISEQFAEFTTNDSTTPSLKFVHLEMPHIPHTRDRDCNFVKRKGGDRKEFFLEQTECALNLALKLIDAMKRLDVFDNSMIVLVSDHGSDFDFGHWEKDALKAPLPRMGKAFPLLMIKPFGVKNDFQLSNTPAQISDVAATIAHQVGWEDAFEGENLMNPAGISARTRNFYYYRWLSQFWSWEYLPDVDVLEVNGNVKHLSSWRKKSTLASPLVKEMNSVRAELELKEAKTRSGKLKNQGDEEEG